MKLISLLWFLGCLLFSQLLYADDSSVEYKIKAGYLYNFTKFITWSADNAETFNLCILGDDPFGELINPITSGDESTIRTPPIKKANKKARKGNSAFSRKLEMNFFIT